MSIETWIGVWVTLIFVVPVSAFLTVKLGGFAYSKVKAKYFKSFKKRSGYEEKA